MTIRQLTWLTIGGTVTALGAVAGYRWRALEVRRVELNKEYIQLLQQTQRAEEEMQSQLRRLHDKEKAAIAMQETINNIWNDRLTRYVETNENLLAYIKALPESLGVLHGLTNHYNYMSAVAREFISFDVSCIKVHILSLLLEHAKRICNGHYCEETRYCDNKAKSLAESDVLSHGSDRYVEHKMKSIWTTLRELYSAEPVIVAVCDSFLLDTSAACEFDHINNNKQKNGDHISAERIYSFSDNGDRRIPSSLHEVSETFNYCLEELEKEIKQSEEKDVREVPTLSTATSAQISATSDVNCKQASTIELNTSNDEAGDGNSFQGNTKSTQGSVVGDIINEFAKIAHVHEMTPAQRAMIKRWHEQEERIKREERQLRTRDDVEAAIAYSSQLLSSFDKSLSDEDHKIAIKPFSTETNEKLCSEQSKVDSTLENEEIANEFHNTHVSQKACTNPAVRHAMEQIRIWQEAATAYLVQSQSLDILDCYSALLAETLTHVHHVEERELESYEHRWHKH